MTVEELERKIANLELRIAVLEDLLGRDHGQKGSDDSDVVEAVP